MQKHAPTPDEDLIEAAGAGSIRQAARALRAGADPLRARDIDGATALMLAAHGGFLGLSSILLPLSLPGATDFLGWNAFMCAVASGSLHCARLLAPHSDILARDRHDRLALDLLNCPAADPLWIFLRDSTHAALEREALASLCPAPAISVRARI